MTQATVNSTAAGSPDFRTWLRPDGIVQIEWTAGTSIDGALARLAIAAGDEACRGQRRNLLVDMRASGPMDKEARTEFGASHWAPAVALWVESPLSVVVANFFLAVSRISRPTKLFSRETDAVAWLNRMRP